jgi:hypothetical protein
MRSLEKALTTSWKEHARVLTGWIEYELGNFSYNQLHNSSSSLVLWKIYLGLFFPSFLNLWFSSCVVWLIAVLNNYGMK